MFKTICTAIPGILGTALMIMVTTPKKNAVSNFSSYFPTSIEIPSFLVSPSADTWLNGIGIGLIVISAVIFAWPFVKWVKKKSSKIISSKISGASILLPHNQQENVFKFIPLKEAINKYCQAAKPKQELIWKMTASSTSATIGIPYWASDEDYAADELLLLAREGEILLFGNKWTEHGELDRIPLNQIPLKRDTIRSELINKCSNKWSYDYNKLLLSAGDVYYTNVSVDREEFEKVRTKKYPS